MANSIQEKLEDLQQQAEANSLFYRNACGVLQKYIDKGKTSLDDIEIGKDFFIAIAFLNAQAKSPKIDHFIRKKLQHNLVNSNLGRGDGEKDGSYYEYKISTTNKDEKINALQIRLWQAIDFYLLGYIDEVNFNQSRLYLVPHDDMKNLCDTYGKATHGTQTVNEENPKVEMTFRIIMKKENEILSLFENKYRTKELEDIIFN